MPTGSQVIQGRIIQCVICGHLVDTLLWLRAVCMYNIKGQRHECIVKNEPPTVTLNNLMV